jgi:hypothetical protein
MLRSEVNSLRTRADEWTNKVQKVVRLVDEIDVLYLSAGVGQDSHRVQLTNSFNNSQLESNGHNLLYPATARGGDRTDRR